MHASAAYSTSICQPLAPNCRCVQQQCVLAAASLRILSGASYTHVVVLQRSRGGNRTLLSVCVTNCVHRVITHHPSSRTNNKTTGIWAGAVASRDHHHPAAKHWTVLQPGWLIN